MRKRIIVLIALTALAFVFQWEFIYAQEEKPGEETEKVEEFTGEEKPEKEAAKEEEEKGAVSDLVNFLKSIHVGFYIDTSYEYNFNRPQDEQNQLRVFDMDDNEFNLHLFQLSFRRTPTTEGGLANLVGFGAKLDFGEDADVIGATGLGDADDEFDLQEAYIHILAPFGNGIDIYGGKFVTLAGAEVIESKDDYNYSRSFLFGFAIPFTHTGIRIHYPVAPFDFIIGLNNGWDTVDDVNDGKTIESRVGLNFEKFSIGVGEYFDDQDGFRTGTAQQLWELTPTLQLRPFAKYSPFDNLLLRLEYRHDQSDEGVFEDNDGNFKKTQDTVAMELLYYFTL